MHEVELVPEHSAHEAWHGTHAAEAPERSLTLVDLSLTTERSTNVPLPHSATHSPLDTKGVAALVHERHSEASGPEHVPQAASHAAQLEEPTSAYMPSGLQSATQLLVALTKKGCVVAQLTHSSAVGPLHVAQLAAHGVHTSGEVAEPPAHVYPPSMVAQSAEQPSRASWLPSSHTSPPTRSPSPHTVTHASIPLKEPPEHV